MDLKRRLSEAYFEKADREERSARFGAAIANYKSRLFLDEHDPETARRLAWILATCPDRQWRDTAEAVVYAEKACEAANGQHWEYLHTHAVACAAHGLFADAVQMQRKAIESLPAPEQARWADNYRMCLRLFESQRPYEWKHFFNLPDRNLLCWWKFDDPESDIFRDRAGRGHDIELAGDVRCIAGDGGVRFRFSGEGFVQCAGAAELDAADALSVVAWICYAPLESAGLPWQQIAGKGDAWGLWTDERHMAVFACSELRMSSSKLYSDVRGVTPLNDTLWHFVAGVYDGQALSLYLDGRLEDRRQASGRLIACSDGISLAAERRDIYPWQGLIREIRVYSRALTAEEVSYLYEATMR